MRKHLMGRPPGSPNKSPRELEAESKRLAEKAKLKRQIEKLKKSKK
jgi:hypothetical protein